VSRPTYAWVVDVDHLVELDGAIRSRVGTCGPSGHREDLLRALQGEGITGLPAIRSWRCKDDDGELYYEGRFIGLDSDMFGPLEDFAQPDAGATVIEYLNPDTNAWEAL